MSGEHGRIICGLQPVREAIRTHGARLSRVVVLEVQSVEASPQLEALARFAHDHGAKVERRPRSDLDRAARGVHHQGAIAFAPELDVTPLHEVPVEPGTLIVALDEIQDPQNFGAIVRSAVAMSASAVVWPEHRSAPLSPSTFRASAGAIEHATLCRVSSLPPALEALRQRGVFVVGLDLNGPTTIDRVDLRGPIALVVGAEGKGLRKTVKRACDALASLPMPGPIGSLNASVAVAIALYECVRQRSAESAGSRDHDAAESSDRDVRSDEETPEPDDEARSDDEDTPEPDDDEARSDDDNETPEADEA